MVTKIEQIMLEKVKNNDNNYKKLKSFFQDIKMGDNPDDYELKIELSIITASNTEKETLIIRTFILKANIREILEKTIDESK